jgi:hypothetical protein
VFIDRKGVIQAQFQGGSDFFKDEEKNVRAKIEEMLKAPSAAPRGSGAKGVSKAPVAAATKKTT